MEFNSLIPELLVSNVLKSLDFYTEMLGFEILFDRKDDGFYFLNKEGGQLMINELKNDSWVNGSISHPFGQGMHLTFKTSYIEEIIKDDSRDSIFLGPFDQTYDVADGKATLREIIYKDPDGYLIRFVEQIQ
ncbi:MAG: VOC family protein [Fibrobacterales bacterium]